MNHPTHENGIGKRKGLDDGKLYGIRAPDRSGRDDRHYGLVYGNVSGRHHVRHGRRLELAGTDALRRPRLQNSRDHLTFEQ